ncbi:MAG: carboxypeptidase-like regulatory domain-containing protein, partial [Cyclobacteriaceae bacterium]|nr:carboxypeptidase-like regulatory domain-containing protein [Cyclobacteriaceae bacterium]
MSPKYSLIILLLFTTIGITAAQTGTIKGKIKTSDVKHLEFVNVGIKGLYKVYTTDRYGYYEIKNIYKGTYK